MKPRATVVRERSVADLLKKMHRLRLKTRGRVRELFGGSYSSCFRGQGMDFDDFRLYEPGDEIRSIDWNVTARQGEPYVKQFIEERELAVYLALDISASGDFGSGEQSKRDWMTEVAALVAFSAVRNQDKVGLLLFSSGLDLFVPPRKGGNHLTRLLREMLVRRPKPGPTRVDAALHPLVHWVGKRSLVFLLSDFISEDFTRSLRTVSQRHDLIAIQVVDPVEETLPEVGRVRMHDPETGRQRLVATSRGELQAAYRQERGRWQEELDAKFRRLAVDKLVLRTGEDFLPKLHAFFKGRARQGR